MKKTVFDFLDYKDYLLNLVGPSTQRRGIKSQLAVAVNCQPTYISQVINGNAHLSLEQGDRLNSFVGHSNEEAHFFLLLLQKERAGTASLKQYFENSIEEILIKRLSLTERLGSKNKLSDEDRNIYYSSWHYAAMHIALTLPQLNKAEALADYFVLPLAKVNQVLDFLEAVGLASVDENREYCCGDSTIRLGNKSHNILRHHANWRQQAIESLDRESLEDMHYSGVVSLSKKDALKIKDRLLERLKEDLELIKDSPEEVLYNYSLDFFSLRKK